MSRFFYGLYTLLYTVLFLSVGKLFLHKNKIFTINACVYHIYNIYLYCCNDVTMVTRQSGFTLLL